MIRHILVALDASPSSEKAKMLSFQLAKTFKSTVTGIGVLDEIWIATPEAIPLGGAAFKVELDEKLLKDAKKQVHKLEKEFTEECKSQNIQGSVIDTIGFPANEIEHFITQSDILVIGKNADFHSGNSKDTADSVQQLLQNNPRPVIVTGPSLPNQNSSHILVAYDGTFASSKALHMALLIGILKNKTVHIASVSTNENEAGELVRGAAALCKNHGFDAIIHPLTTSKKPAEALLELTNEVKPSLLVMGAYGHSGFAYFFKGSCSKDLLKSTDIPLFVYH